LADHVIVPVGDCPATVAVQTVDEPRATGDGEQFRDVVVVPDNGPRLTDGMIPFGG